MKTCGTIIAALAMLSANCTAAAAATDADIVIYGSTPAAISAAIQARRMGAKAVVVSPETRIGGLTTGGLGQTDIGIKSAFGGIALEFYRAVAKWYADPSHWKHGKAEEYLPDGQCAGTQSRDAMWTFEPSAALAILEGWEKRDRLDIRRGERLDRNGGIEKKDGMIVAMKSLSGKVYRGKVFIDATYEGDLMAAAGVSYHVGREPRSAYGETVAGNVPDAIGEDHHNFHDGVSAYVVEGDRQSGLLPGVEPHNPSARPGDGDSRVQAYCFRMCLTDVPENRIPFRKPDGYDERDYELLFREYAAMVKNPTVKVDGCLDGENPIPFIMSRMPNGKTDCNNRTGFSSDFIGGNWAWPDASYEEREAIFRHHLDRQRGLMWTLANHSRIPANVRAYFSRWGTCRDEFFDGPGDGWQSQLYVREARRMVGESVMTEHHCRGSRTSPRPIALAAFGMDSHHVRRVETADGFVRNEGNFEDARSADMKTRMAAWGIDYGAIVPKRGECRNLIVPVCVSASHAAFGSIRMEPVFFALGQAAGTAAVMAGAADCAVQDVDYAALVRRLAADGQALPPSVKMRSGTSPAVPVFYKMLGGNESTCLELRRINAMTGLRRFFLCGPCFNDVMFGPFPDDLYVKIGEDVAAVKRGLADTDIEISWWCTPSIRYFSDFPSIEDFKGNVSKDNKKCPLDEAFAADYAAKVQSVARAHPAMICIEDDYTLSWGRGLNGGACYCKRHLADFAKRYGKALSAVEIADAFQRRSPENLAIRRAFSDTLRESMVSLARKVRAAVDAVDPSIRIMVCESGGAEKDGDLLEAVARAFAGGTRPAVRPRGAIYGAETTPATIPDALAHAVWVCERLPADIEKFYEADVYPHNRFYSSASQLMSLMAGAAIAGTDDYLFYCLQYLDDPLEDRGYADAFLSLKPRIDAVRRFVRERGGRLCGARIYWRAEDMSLTRGIGYSHGGQQLWAGSYLLSKFGVPYTTRPDGGGPVLLMGEVAETMSDVEIRELLSGGLLVDGPAAALLASRGFGDLLCADVQPVEGRPRIVDERIRPEAGCSRRGKRINAFYVFSAGSEGTAERFVRIVPHEGSEVWGNYYGPDGTVAMPSVVFSRNRLGGRVGIIPMAIIGNRSSGLYNLRKQELVRNLLERLSPESIPVSAIGTPGIWVMASVSADGKQMLLMVNNLSGDERDGVRLAFSGTWCGAEVSRLDEKGQSVVCGRAEADWTVPFSLGQMQPEFLVLKVTGH